MSRYSIPPTKANLLKLKQDLIFAKEGHKFLDQKREILVAELLNLVDRASDLQRKVNEELAYAYKAVELAVVRMGKRQVLQMALAVNIKAKINISDRRTMGVRMPVIETTYRDNPPYFSLGNSTFWLDEAIFRFREALKVLGKFAESKISVLRLAQEVKKTIHRVNALEKIAIPDYEETLQYIQDVLEEISREEMFILKLLKSRLRH